MGRNSDFSSSKRCARNETRKFRAPSGFSDRLYRWPGRVLRCLHGPLLPPEHRAGVSAPKGSVFPCTEPAGACFSAGCFFRQAVEGASCEQRSATYFRNEFLHDHRKTAAGEQLLLSIVFLWLALSLFGTPGKVKFASTGGL